MHWIVALAVTVAIGSPAPAVEQGAVRVATQDDPARVPERYRLAPHEFEYTLAPKTVLPHSGVEVYKLTFPSPVSSPYPENNTVHAEYFRPVGAGPFPAVIVLDILDGSQIVSRGLASVLASNKVAALCVQMAYYGPRRPPGIPIRLLTPNIPQTLDAIRQTVLDCRRATAWLESRPEVDPERLGILGTSLGSFLGALTAEMEPKLKRVALLLSGGGFVDGYWDDPRAIPFRKPYELLGGSKEKVAALIAPADPLTYAANLKAHQLLMLAASRDDIVPPKMAERLWQATGQQRIVWYDATHVGAAVYVVPALAEILKLFAAP
jgi:dienelactone hydrolase